MHFYVRLGKKEEIDKFAKDNKMKYLGMPCLIGNGSQEVEELRHRFLVMPRYGRDIWKIFIEQNRRFPLHTVYRLGWQLSNILEYIHTKTYVHMDIKGANIMLGFNKKTGGDEQIHLLDYGLACHYNTKEYKPDVKKAHNGTIEYTSRDAHNGVATQRGDIEILAYNLIEWAGATLPWTKSQQMLQKPVEVQKLKEEFMKSIDKSVKAAFESIIVPSQLFAFIKYVQSMQHDTNPDFKKIRGFFESGLKELKQSNTGNLDFIVEKAGTSKVVAAKSPVKRQHQDVIIKKNAKQQKTNNEPTAADDSTDEEITARTARAKRLRERKQVNSDDETDEKPAKQKAKPTKAKQTPEKNENKNATNAVSPSQNKTKKGEDAAKVGQLTLKSKSGSSKKTVQLNFDLDISFDSDLVVTINRKDRKKQEEKAGRDDVEKKKMESDANDEDHNNKAGFYKGKYAKPAK